MKKIAKAKAGKSLGMKSVKAGYDNNPGVTRADIISAAKMKAGKAKYGKTMKAQKGASVKERVVEKSIDLPKKGFPRGNSPGYARTKFDPGTPKGKDPNRDYSTYQFTKLPGYEGIKEGQLTPKKTPKSKNGAKVAAKKPIKKAQNGMKTVDVPEFTKKAKSLKRGMMDIALGDDRKMSIDTTNYKKQRSLPDFQKDLQTYKYTISDKSGKVIQKSKLKSEPSQTKEDIVNNMVKGLESGKMKRPTFKSGGKMSAKKTVAKKGISVKKAVGKCKMGC